MFLLLESLVCFMCVLWSFCFVYFVYRSWYHHLIVYWCLMHFRLSVVCLFFWYPWGYLWEYHDVWLGMLCRFIYIAILFMISTLFNIFFQCHFGCGIEYAEFFYIYVSFFLVSGVVLKQSAILLAWTHICVAPWCCGWCCVARAASWCPPWLLHHLFGCGASFIACSDPLPYRKGWQISFLR